MIAITFEAETPFGPFKDTLHFEERAVISDAEIAALKRQRVENWIAVITAPPAIEEPAETITTPEEVAPDG